MKTRKLRLRSRSFDVGRKTLVMGILNVTPDSFSGDGIYRKPSHAVSNALKMMQEGADIIDVGGESTKPGSDPVSAQEEIRRIMPVINGLVKAGVPVSVDTYKPEVAREALDADVEMVNDVTGLRNEKMAELVSDYKAGIVIMHMNGEPKTMQQNPVYRKGVVKEVRGFFVSRIRAAEQAGIRPENIVIDPGIGFGKTIEHNLDLIRNLSSFKDLKLPILVGPSRKSFIGKVLDLPADQRLEGTIAAVVASVMNGADIIRVHDVRECSRAAKLTDAIVKGAVN